MEVRAQRVTEENQLHLQKLSVTYSVCNFVISNSYLLMKILNAVNLIGCINCKWNTIQGFATDDTAETLQMVGPSCCS